MTKPIGLQEGVETKEKIIKVDEKTAKKYRVVEETIDLEALKREKEQLEAQLQMPEPTQEELIEAGKLIHPYYQINKEAIQERIKQIEELLNSVS